MEMTFLRMEWPGCSSIEVSGNGNLRVGDEEATEEEFTLALARMAQAWSDSIIDPPDCTSVTAYFLRGPLPFWKGEDKCEEKLRS